MSDFEGLDELRLSCPPGTSFVGPEGAGGLEAAVNEKIAAACMKPDGTVHGPSATWYANGAKATAGSYQQGGRQGEWTYWYENGQMSGRGAFDGGKPEGTWVTWHDNGQKESEGSYAEGHHHGRFTHWDREGQILKVLYYERGDLTRTVSYCDGKPLE